MKIKQFFLAPIILLLLAQILLPQSLSGNQSSGQVYGGVVDRNDARVTTATVEARSGDRVFRTRTDWDGVYKLDLPAGIYQIVVSSECFCPSTRALFQVGQGNKINFDFALVDCSHSLRANRENDSQVCAYEAPFQEESIDIPYFSKNSLNLFIRYGKREEQGAIITYSSFMEEITPPRNGYNNEKRISATASYNLFTIQADKIEVDKQAYRLKASGNVLFADGTKPVKANLVEIRFKEGAPVINIQ